MTDALREAFQKTRYQLAGHGPRTIGVLATALSAYDEALASDYYGTGPVIERFESKMAAYLGKEAAVFFPSGTMAQQIALRVWCDQTGDARVAYHPLCHLEIHENQGLRLLHGMNPMLVGESDRLIELEDLESLDQKPRVLLLELPQREIGGQLPRWEDLVAMARWCRAQDILLHLDGARLYETLPYYERSAAEVASLFDSVYISFYKGIGAVAGAILAGPRAFMDQAVIWKRRHGGDLISLYPYILAADYYFDRRVGKMGEYLRGAQDLADRFHRCAAVSTVPNVPVTNMFHVHVLRPLATVDKALYTVASKTGVGFASQARPMGTEGARFEISVGDQYRHIPKPLLEEAFHIFEEALG